MYFLDSIIDKMKTRFTIILMICCLPVFAQADWQVMSHTDTDSGLQTRVAMIENADHYKLEIYRDTNNAIRLRFNIRDSYDVLASKRCPSYQVDERELSNRSINDAPCISQPRWAEYVMGYIDNQKVISVPLHNLMNGKVVYYRFLLKNGSYGETTFSLAGSKRILNTALGENLTVLTKSE